MITTVFNAIDDQEHSGWAADSAIHLARATSSMIVFLMANPAVLPGRGPMIYRWTKDYIEEYFYQAKCRARKAGVYDVKCITKNTLDIPKTILSEAWKAQAQYIVLGSDCHRGLFGNWKQSITREVSANAHCPTIIVHTALNHRQNIHDLVA